MTAVDTQPERFWTLEGCDNFRNLGGHRTSTGATLRWRRLLRSDSLASASPSDRVHLSELGLAAVIDLRCPHEVALSGHYREEGVAYHHLPFGDLLGLDADWEAWRDPAYVAGRYFELCFSARSSISEAFAILTDPCAYPASLTARSGRTAPACSWH